MCRMKILFLSDIHGVPSTLEQALATAAPLGYDRIVLLGDLLYHGARNALPGGYDTMEAAEILKNGGVVGMPHIMKALYRENTKLKRIAFDGDYGGYAYLLHD